MDRFEAKLAGDPDIDHWSSYVGQGAVRFILSFDPQPSNPQLRPDRHRHQGHRGPRAPQGQDQDLARQEFVGIDIYVDLLSVGPAGRTAGAVPPQRARRPEGEGTRAETRGAGRSKHPRVSDIGFNWNEPARVVKVDVLQDKARQLGVTSEDIAGALNSVVGGTSITQVRDAIYLVDVVSRARAAERQLDRDAAEPAAAGQERPVRPARRGRDLPLRARAAGDLAPRPPADDHGQGRHRRCRPSRRRSCSSSSRRCRSSFAALPAGYRVAVGGPVEESAKSQGPIAAVVPLMLFIMATILMIQLQSFSRLFLVVAVAPLGLIGVVAAMLPAVRPWASSPSWACSRWSAS